MAPVTYYKGGRTIVANTPEEVVHLEYNGWTRSAGTTPPVDPTPTGGLQLGTTATTAKRGDYAPTWAEVTSKPATFAPAAHVHPVNALTDASVVGKSILTASSAAAIRTLLGVNGGTGGTSLTLGTTATTAKRGDYVPTWTEITSKPTTFPPDKTGLAKADVGLGNVDNTSDANKPLSTAAATAIAGKPDFVIVTTGTEARPTGSVMTIWNEQRTGTPAAPTNMNTTTDVWLH